MKVYHKKPDKPEEIKKSEISDQWQEMEAKSDHEVALVSDQEQAPISDQEVAPMSDQEMAPTSEAGEVPETVPQLPKENFDEQLYVTEPAWWKLILSNFFAAVIVVSIGVYFIPPVGIYKDSPASEVVASVKQVAEDTRDLLGNANQTFYIMSVLSYSNDWFSVSPEFALHSTLPYGNLLSYKYKSIVSDSDLVLRELFAYKNAVDQFSRGLEVSLKTLLDDTVGARKQSAIDSLWRLFMYVDDLADQAARLTSGRVLCADLKSSLREIEECGVKLKGVSPENRCKYGWGYMGPSKRAKADLKIQKNIYQQLQNLSSLYEAAGTLFYQAQNITDGWQKNRNTIQSHLRLLQRHGNKNLAPAERLPWKRMRRDLMTLIPLSERVTKLSLYVAKYSERKTTAMIASKKTECENTLDRDQKYPEVDLMECFFDSVEWPIHNDTE
jgi:hypothetical protein